MFRDEKFFDLQRFASISNSKSNCLVTGTSGNDSISNSGDKVTINAGAGNDTIMNSGSLATIWGGEGDDYVKMGANGGKGGVYVYTGGNDTVDVDYWCLNTIVLGDVSVESSVNSDSYSILNLSNGKTLKLIPGYTVGWHVRVVSSMDEVPRVNTVIDSDESFVSYTGANQEGTIDLIANGGDKVTISGNKSNYWILNTGSNGKITTGTGNDTVFNWGGHKSTISTGAGDDGISNSASNVSISSGSGDDFIENRDGNSNVTVDAGDGNDYIYNPDGENCLINAGTGDDRVDLAILRTKVFLEDGDDLFYAYGTRWPFSDENTGDDYFVDGGAGDDNFVLHGGKGDDFIKNVDGANLLITYTTGDGNDYVNGFNATSTLRIGGGTSTYSSQVSGNDVIVTVGEGKITLQGAANLSSVNIDGKAPETNSWKLNGTTATYGTSSKTLVTVKGVKSTESLSVSGKVVTVSKASLNKKAVTISNGYTLKLGDDVKKSTSTAATWSLSNSTATYKSGKRTAGYKLASNKISYVTASGGSTLATVKGVKYKPTLSGEVVTLTTSNIGTAKKVSVSGNYTFNFSASDYKKTSITGTANADTIVINGTNLFISGGKGNDSLVSNSSGGNVFVYASGDGNDVITNFAASDKLSIKSSATYSVSGSDVVFTVGTGKITLKGASDKTFTYYVDGDKKTYSNVTLKPYTISGKGISLTNAYTETDFDLSTVTGGSKIVTIDASAVKHGLNISGNSLANSIIGGSGNDTLAGDKGKDTLHGGAGKDVFLYYDGCGKDIVDDYNQNDDIVQIGKGKIATVKASGKNIVLTTENGSITVKNAATQGFTYIDEDDIEHDLYKGKSVVTTTKDTKGKLTATLSDKYWKTSFDAANFGTIKIINAQAVTHDLSITGTADANMIHGAAGDNTINGGKGNDKIYGGDGSNTYIYNSGGGNDRIVSFGSSDIVSIKGARVSDTDINGDTVIFTVGKGRISLGSAASYDTDVTWYDNDGKHTQMFAPNAFANENMWFMDDEDNYIGTDDNQLSSIVRDENFAFNAPVPSSYKLVPTNDSLPALTYSDKK